MTCAASLLLAPLLDDSRRAAVPLREAARTRVSVHYETGRADLPVLSVGSWAAVRLPGSVLVRELPTGPVAAARGGLLVGGSAWRVTRWWRPPRPSGLRPPREVRVPDGVVVPDQVAPVQLLGRGPGLTPRGDDVLAGALVAAHAVADPRLPHWQAQTRAALRRQRTTAVSRGLLHQALEGWAIPELADFLSEACEGVVGAATDRLLAVGHSSGPALAAGALHVLAPAPAGRWAAR